MNQIIICGAGEWGYLAYWDRYKDSNVLAFIDINDQAIHQILQTGVPMKSIQYLDKVSRGTKFVVAIKDQIERGIALELLKKLNFIEIEIYSPSSRIDAQYLQKLLDARATSAIKELEENRSLDLNEFLMNETRGGGAIRLKELTFVMGGSGEFDYALLYSLARKYRCKKYLEVGTYIGESINILTDLCDELHSITATPGSPFSMKNWCRKRNIPDYSERLTYSPKIVHHYCEDSKAFDYAQIPRDIDLYFIDADHSFIGVYYDTLNVFKHRKPDSIVVWHDFKNADPEVSNEVAWAVKTVLPPEMWKDVFCFDLNMCGIYLPSKMQRDFSFSQKQEYSEEPQELWCYDVTLALHKR